MDTTGQLVKDTHIPLVFKEEDHSYWLGARRLPSVTQILSDLGFVSPFAKNPDKARLGKYVHEMIALYEEGELDEDALDPRLGEYLSRWKLIRTPYPPTVRIVLESAVYSEPLGLAGTPDLLVYDDEGVTIVDFKSGNSKEDWHKLQIGGYAALIPEAQQGQIAYVGKTPRLVAIDIEREKREFFACLTVWRRRFACNAR